MKGFDALHTTPQPATGLTLSYSKCSAGLYSHGRDTSETPRIDHGLPPVPARWKPAQPDSICRCARSPTTSVSPQQGLPETSNNIIIQKGLAFGRDWSGTVVNPERMRASEILPRRLHGRGGALVVRRDAAINRNGGSRCQSLRRSDHLGQHTPKRLPQSRRRWQWPIPRGRIKPIRGSKQSRVIAMLQSPAGATIAAMMKATGWQQHSVRGFLAGVVRKRLKLKLGSKKVDGIRVYQIAGVEKSKRAPRKSERLIWRRVTEL